MINLNAFLMAYLGIYLLSSSVDLIIEVINARSLNRYKETVPGPFRGVIDEEKLGKINRYTLDKTRFSLIETIAGRILFLFIILSGLLPALSEILRDLHFVPAGLIFFAVPGLFGAILDLPFDYYHIFVIEEKYGFNTRTVKAWLSDLMKSLMIAVILGAFLLSLLLVMVKYAGSGWWVYAWLFFFSFQILMVALYPALIAPIFNKFVPIENEELSERIERLAAGQGFNIKGIFQMDATRRSRHTNAYLSGLGKSKRIVLFDTLLEAHDNEEIVAVLAHEMGHFKKKHITKQLVVVGLASMILFYLASKIITWGTLYESFGFSLMPAYAGLFLAAVLWEPVGFFLSPIAMAISRRFEREADQQAFRALKSTEPLVRALKKMARDNLSNLRPHPLYVWFNHSHPPLLERIKTLEDVA